MTQEVLKMALEALESCNTWHITDGSRQWYDEKLVDKAITAIEEALAEQQQKPAYRAVKTFHEGKPIYVAETSAPPLECKTEAEKTAFAFGWFKALKHGGCPPDCKDGMTDSGGVHPWGEPVLIPCPNCAAIARAIEAAHGIKE